MPEKPAVLSRTTAAAPPAPAPVPVATMMRQAQRSERMAYAPLPFSSEKFPDKQPNKITLVAEQPVSTFSADVDTASYAFVRRQLTAGRVPPAEAVRVEEMVNYFPYKYASPARRSEPFAVTTEVMPSPWKAGNQLVHIALKGFDIQTAERPSMNVVLLVDVSGSMGPQDRLPLLKQGFRLFAEQLRDQDRVAIVSYADGTRVVLEPTSGKDKHKIIDAIDSLGAGGGTAGGEGLQRAYEMAQRNFDPRSVNRVILATDGDFNLGITDPKQLEQFIADKRKSGVYLSIFGVGMGNLNDALIQRLAQSGNGNAAYIDSLLEARKALSEELASTMFPIANDVKVQVEFNPGQVAAYRLIGYETRALNREDFKDDKVDAGDMGAGHTVTAIYEITPAGAASSLVDPLRYGDEKGGKKVANDKGDELCFVKVRYKLPGESASRLTEHAVHAASARRTLDAVPEDQRFAVAVAAFGQRLRGEPQVADFSYADIASMANSARGTDVDGYRAEFVKLVRTMESLGKVGLAGRD
jgi:Ca-activated chloride channel family protein